MGCPESFDGSSPTRHSAGIGGQRLIGDHLDGADVGSDDLAAVSICTPLNPARYVPNKMFSSHQKEKARISKREQVMLLREKETKLKLFNLRRWKGPKFGSMRGSQ